MKMERMFELVEGLRDTARADATLGKPREIQGRVLLPVAAVATGFGLGFGHGPDDEARKPGEAQPQTPEADEEQMSGEGGGAGGGSGSRPLAMIEVTADGTAIRPMVDETKVALAGMALVAWVVFWLAATVRAVFCET